VFVVGCLGDWRSGAAVLFERNGLCRDIAPSREKREEIARCVKTGVGARPINTMIATRHNALGERTNLGIGEEGDPAYTITKAHSHAIAFSSNMSVPDCQEDVSPTLKLGGHGGGNPPAVAIDVYNQTIDGNVAATLSAACGGSNTSGPKLMQHMAVRRLTPVECERLQGFPDNYTNIKEKCPDGPRYKALGNSMAVPVMRWIGQRIQAVNDQR
jgi:DNA (cytosine-5)-methyltransferase 1